MTTTNDTPTMDLRTALGHIDDALRRRGAFADDPAAIPSELKDAHNLADGVMAAMTMLDVVHIAPALRAMYNAAELIMDEHGECNFDNHLLHLGQVLMLDVLIQSPEAVASALRLLRERLVDADPCLLSLRPR